MAGRSSPDEAEHGDVAYDLSDWSPEQRLALELHLRGEGIPFGWEGATLRVPVVHEARVDDVIDGIADQPPAAEPSVRRVPDVPQVAGRRWRLLGALLDFLVLTPAALLVLVPAGDVINSAVMAGYFIVPTAVRGRTIGKSLVRTRVVRSDGSPVGWWGASVRYAVGVVPAWVLPSELWLLALLLPVGPKTTTGSR
jgi:hypothetical protein